MGDPPASENESGAMEWLTEREEDAQIDDGYTMFLVEKYRSIFVEREPELTDRDTVRRIIEDQLRAAERDRQQAAQRAAAKKRIEDRRRQQQQADRRRKGR